MGRPAGAAASIDAAKTVHGVPRTSNGSKRFAGDSLERLWVPDRAAWRAWLEENHGRDVGVWLVSFKKATGKPRVEYDDAVEEALCFGWIDSLVRTLDAGRAMQLFSPRKPRSPWSRSNKLRVEKLIAAGLMRPAGLAKIEQAKRDGAWDVYAVAESLEEPADLVASFAAGPRGAKANWDAFSPSSRRAILWWVHSAKRPETRAARIAQVVSAAALNRRANFPVDRER
ncbi:MAG TPA: YdeI/OmpD-associated family protein [Myxococcaceae bacterium]|nr:YdeI/OmpD-associated family protein [Myxococcaceae bacterium]